MTRKQKSLPLYILAAVIMLVSVNYIVNRASDFNEARRREAIENMERHGLTLVTGQIYHEGTDFNAAFQVTSEYGEPMLASLRAFFNESPDSYVVVSTSYCGRGTINLPLENPGHLTLVMAVESARVMRTSTETYL